MWGKEDGATYDLLSQENITGTWLNLASGDGRYNSLLIEKADAVIACDKDLGALESLSSKLPPKFQNKLTTLVFDINQDFPFEENCFDGILCTGALHLFSRNKLKHIFSEIQRILKKDGIFIFDFATDIKRIDSSGELYKFKKTEPEYTLSQAMNMLETFLSDYIISIEESEVQEEHIRLENISYQFTCKFLLVSARLRK